MDLPEDGRERLELTPKTSATGFHPLAHSHHHPRGRRQHFGVRNPTSVEVMR
jgi:hypothetical protein